MTEHETPAMEPRWLQRWARRILIVYWPALFASTHWPQLSLGESGEKIKEFANPDKLVHFVLFGTLTLLIAYARLLGKRVSTSLNLLFAAGLAAGYGAFDEFSQGWTPDREVSWQDLNANLVATAAVFILLMLYEAHWRRAQWPVLVARLAVGLALPMVGLAYFMPGFSYTQPIPYADELPLPTFLAEMPADKIAHFLVAAGMCSLLIPARLLGSNRPWAGGFASIVLVACLGVAIEYGQLAVKRGFDINDLAAHQWGVLTAGGGWLFLRIASIAGRRKDEQSPRGKEQPQRGGFVGSAILISALTLLSRFTGLIRDAVLAALFGLGAVADAFFIGFLVPNLFRRLFGEGALTAAFIPIYSQLLETDRQTARRLASLCIALLMLVLGALTVVGELVLWSLADARAWSDDTSLAINLTMVMLPYMPLICLVALLGAMLQVHGRFGPPAAAPILLNLIMIAAAGVALLSVGEATDADMRRNAYWIAMAVIFAGVAQAVWQIGALLRVESLTTKVAETWPHMRSVLIMMGPMLVGLAVFQINTFLDSLIAFFLSPKDGGAATFSLLGREVAYPIEVGGVAALQWSQRLYQFPLGVFGVAVATAIFPALTRAAAAGANRVENETGDDGDDGDAGQTTSLEASAAAGDFRAILQQGLRLTMFIGLPASVGLMIVRLPLARVIYERGQFTLDDAERVAHILTGYAAAIWAYSMTHVLTRAFYALKDARTPLLVSTTMVMLNLLLNIALIWPLGIAALAWSSAVCAMGQVMLLLISLRNHIESPLDANVLRGWMRTAGLALIMAGVLVGLSFLWPAADEARWSTAAAELATLVIVGVLVFVGSARLCGAGELRWLLSRNR